MYEDETINLTATLTTSGTSAATEEVFYTFRLLPQTATAVKARVEGAIANFEYPVSILEVTSGVANEADVALFSSGVNSGLIAAGVLCGQADYLAGSTSASTFNITCSLVYTSGTNSGVVTINASTGELTYNSGLELTIAQEDVTVKLTIAVSTPDDAYDFTVTKEWDLALVKNA